MIAVAILDDDYLGLYKDEATREGFLYPGTIPNNRIGLIVFGLELLSPGQPLREPCVDKPSRILSSFFQLAYVSQISLTCLS